MEAPPAGWSWPAWSPRSRSPAVSVARGNPEGGSATGSPGARGQAFRQGAVRAGQVVSVGNRRGRLHRPTTIKLMDRILVMEGGRIIESGTFDELYAKRGRFHGLWEKQGSNTCSKRQETIR